MLRSALRLRTFVGVPLVSFLCVGCGASTIDASYPGTPMLHMAGKIDAWDDPPTSYPIRASLFWSSTGKFDLNAVGSMHEDNSVRIEMDFPAAFTMSVYKAPEKPWEVSGKNYAVGAILVYEDRVGQGRFIPGKTPIRGGAPRTVVFYSKSHLAPQQSPFDMPIGPGMVQLDLPLPCGNVEVGGTSSARLPGCPAGKIGSPCNEQKDCAQREECVKMFAGLEFREGYCSRVGVLDCLPEGSVAVGLSWHESDVKPDASTSIVLRACQQDADCRSKEGYRCDRFVRGCLPVEPVILEMTSEIGIEAFCWEDVEAPLP